MQIENLCEIWIITINLNTLTKRSCANNFNVFGIIIRMYYGPKKHNPPHIRAYYQDYTATFELKDGDLLMGEMPRRQTKMIQAWIEIRKDELYADCELCQNGEKLFKFDPLK